MCFLYIAGFVWRFLCDDSDLQSVCEILKWVPTVIHVSVKDFPVPFSFPKDGNNDRNTNEESEWYNYPKDQVGVICFLFLDHWNKVK